MMAQGQVMIAPLGLVGSAWLYYVKMAIIQLDRGLGTFAEFDLSGSICSRTAE